MINFTLSIEKWQRLAEVAPKEREKALKKRCLALK